MLTYTTNNGLVFIWDVFWSTNSMKLRSLFSAWKAANCGAFVDSPILEGGAKLQGPRAEWFILSGWEMKLEKKQTRNRALMSQQQQNQKPS